jgi:TonB family protein
MKTFLWVLAAVLFHALLLLFGKALLPSSEKKDEMKVTEVDLTDAAKEPEEAEKTEEKPEEVETPPDQLQLDTKVFEAAEAAPEAPAALSAMSLSDLAGALGGAMSDFGGGGGLSSGGAIGGTGMGTGGGGMADGALGGSDVDERPRPVGAPSIKLPPALRKSGGKVVVRLVVDDKGKISNPQVESSTNSALNSYVLDGVRTMNFEPATRKGRPVSCKVRLPVVMGVN